MGKKAHHLPCRCRNHPRGSSCHRCDSYRQMSSWGHRFLRHRELHRPLPGKGGGEFWIRVCPMLGAMGGRIMPSPPAPTKDYPCSNPWNLQTFHGKGDSAGVIKDLEMARVFYTMQVDPV